MRRSGISAECRKFGLNQRRSAEAPLQLQTAPMKAFCPPPTMP